MSFLDELLKTIQDATREPPAPEPVVRRRAPAPVPVAEMEPQRATHPYPRARLALAVRETVPAVLPIPAHPSAQSLRVALRSPAALRQALLLREVLGPPLALRRP